LIGTSALLGQFNMRLSTDQIFAIRQAATVAFGQGTSVWLFGSRVDDAKKGGDIDLLVCPQPQAHKATDAAEVEQGFMQKIKMLTLLERHLGERKVDLVVEQPQDMRPIVEVAHKTGIKLQ
jgi:predicted nucleotidyltransferase